MIEDWRAFLPVDPDEDILARLRLHARTGRPLGSDAFLRQLEAETGLPLLPHRFTINWATAGGISVTAVPCPCPAPGASLRIDATA